MEDIEVIRELKILLGSKAYREEDIIPTYMEDRFRGERNHKLMRENLADREVLFPGRMGKFFQQERKYHLMEKSKIRYRIKMDKIYGLHINGANCKNPINTLLEQLAQLDNLESLHLDLSMNDFREFPEGIIKLTSLKYLNLTFNKIAEIPESISKLISLTDLNLSGNYLKEISKGITNLKCLTNLYLSKNQIKKIPDDIHKLASLKYLILSDNELDEISRNIEHLPSLRYLNISNNKLKSIPGSIINLKSLVELKISDNELLEVPDTIINLKTLERLDLSNNHLISLPKNIINIKNVSLDGNPLEDPPMEIVKEGNNAINQYFEEIEKGERIPLNEVKIVLVGNGEAGKTNLIRKFFNEPFIESHDATDGISIRDDKYTIQNKDIKVHFWDFGGQEIMHSTHQFFLTRKTVYILVLDGRKDERPEEWLGLIKSVSGDSPILIAINKIDQNPFAEIENKRQLNQDYPSIDGNFFKISCKDGTGIENLKKRLKSIIYDMPTTKSYWSKGWLNIKEYLETNAQNYISHEEYLRKCEEEGILEASRAVLLDYLHNLGVLLHFEDIPIIGTKVLKAKWVTEGIYKIINSALAESKKGNISISSDLRQILNAKDYPPSVYPYIINLMKKFELCYSMTEEKILIPDQLDKEEPDHNFMEKDSLRFIFEYKEYLPRSILVRFIVGKHNEIHKDYKWRTGVILSNPNFNSQAYIRADYNSKKIYLYVNGERKRDYFATLWDSLKKINEDYRTPIDEKIPVSETTYFITYKALLNYEKQGELNPYIGEIDKRIDVVELLDGIEDPRARKRKLEKEKKEEKHFHEHTHYHEGDKYGNIENAIIKSEIKAKDFIQTKTEGISPEQLQEILNNLISEFNKKQNYPAAVEEKLDDLYDLVDKSIASSFKNRTYFETKIVKKWLPDYNQLNDLSLEYLLSAEFLFDVIYKSNGDDYSPFILQYCRSIENELKKKIFEAFKAEFVVSHSIDMNSFLFWDNTNNKKFCKAISKPDKDFMLGDMIEYLEKVNDSSLITNSPLMQEFKNFLAKNFEINILLRADFIKNLSDMKDLFRNEAAHPNKNDLDMNQVKAEQGKTLVRNILKEWLNAHN